MRAADRNFGRAGIGRGQDRGAADHQLHLLHGCQCNMRQPKLASRIDAIISVSIDNYTGPNSSSRMKTTQYFRYTRQRPDRIFITDEWIEQTVENPLREERQSDGRIRRWARISEMDNRVLRVILLEDGETVHNAFFDRNFKE